jgi:general secretion pathway protein H
MGQRAEVGARGFTLLELIVTLFVIALAVGVVGPAIGRSTDGLRARADVAGFSSFFRHAREQAITRGEALRVVVEPGARRLTIVAGEGEIRRTRVFSERLVIDPATPSALTVRFEPEGRSTGGEYRLATGATAYRVTVDPITGRVRSARE